MQDLTPLEIQKQTFTRNLKGYNLDEVRAYLHSWPKEIERLLKDIDRMGRENGAPARGAGGTTPRGSASSRTRSSRRRRCPRT